MSGPSDRPSSPDALAGLRALAAKYRELALLRRARERGEPTPPKEVFRRLAAKHPGALYELDTLEVVVIEARAEALERVIAGQGEVESWMRWMVRYHHLVHEELGARRRTRAPGGGPRARATALAIAQIAAEDGVTVDEVSRALFARQRRGVPRRDP